MRQRLDITDVEAQTKIRAKYLRALENEDFGMLPGPTFVKSFLRTYAEFLGLDPHLLVEEYRVRYDPRDESELTPFARPPKGRQRRRPPRRPAWLPVVAAVVVILGLLLVLGLTGGGSSDNSGKSATTSTSAKKTTSAAERRAARKRARERAAARRRAERARRRTVTLRVAPTIATYVCVDKGVGTPVVFEGTLTTPKSWKSRHLRINLGRRAVVLTANGKRVVIPTGADPIGFDFRGGTQHVITGTRPCG